MSTGKTATPSEVQTLLKKVGSKAEASESFASVEVTERAVVAAFIDEDVEAEFRIEWTDAGLEVCMKTPDRWLSQSVEADLVNSGDDLEELIDEELVDLGCEEGPLPIKHFRDDERLYVFTSPLPIEDKAADSEEAADTATACLLAYERVFAQLGDFAGSDED